MFTYGVPVNAQRRLASTLHTALNMFDREFRMLCAFGYREENKSREKEYKKMRISSKSHAVRRTALLEILTLVC